MSGMTWKQFKDYVDAQLEEREIGEDEEVWYIDISHPRAKTEEDAVGFAVSVGYCGLYIN